MHSSCIQMTKQEFVRVEILLRRSLTMLRAPTTQPEPPPSTPTDQLIKVTMNVTQSHDGLGHCNGDPNSHIFRLMCVLLGSCDLQRREMQTFRGARRKRGSGRARSAALWLGHHSRSTLRANQRRRHCHVVSVPASLTQTSKQAPKHRYSPCDTHTYAHTCHMTTEERGVMGSRGR